MAARAMVWEWLARDIEATTGDLLVTINAKYVDYTNDVEEWREFSVNVGWPGLTTVAFHQAIRDAIIANRPSGSEWDLGNGDVLLGVFTNGSLI